MIGQSKDGWLNIARSTLGIQVEHHSPWLPNENIRHSFAWIKGAVGPASIMQETKLAYAIIEEMKRHGVAGQKLGCDVIDVNMIQAFKDQGNHRTDGMSPMMMRRVADIPLDARSVQRA